MSKPIKVYEDFPFKLSVWKNENKKESSYSALVTKSYYDDKNKEWKDTNYLSPRDSLCIMRLLDKYYYDFGIKVIDME